MDISRFNRQASITLAVLAMVGHAVIANEVTVQNDSGAGMVTCPCFVPGEETAVWLTAPCSGNVTAVQIGWGSTFGGAPDSIEMAIRVYDGSTFPTPGSVLLNKDGSSAEVLGPQLIDGAINQFGGFDVPVSAGQTFAVSLEFLNQNAGDPFAPSAVHDGDGCQPGLSGVKAVPGGWSDACLLGVTGDWVIRAVIQCEKSTVPTVSEWGLVVMTLFILCAGTLVFARSARSNTRAR